MSRQVRLLIAVALALVSGRLLSAEHVLLDEFGVKVTLSLSGVAPFEGGHSIARKEDFRREFSLCNRSGEELLYTTVTVVKTESSETEKSRVQPAVTPVNHSWSVGNCWSVSHQRGQSYSNSRYRSHGARWDFDRSIIHESVVLETRCLLKSGVLLKSRKRIPVEVETISKTDLETALRLVDQALSTLESAPMHDLQRAVLLPEYAEAFSPKARFELLQNRSQDQHSARQKAIRTIRLTLAKHEVSDSKSIRYYLELLFTDPFEAIAHIRDLGIWDRCFEEPLMMVFEDSPNPRALYAISELFRCHKAGVHRTRLTTALRSHGYLARSQAVAPTPYRLRTTIHVSRLPQLFPNLEKRRLFFEHFHNWPRDENGEPLQQFRTEKNYVPVGISDIQLCELLATVGDSSTIEPDLMPLLKSKEQVWSFGRPSLFCDEHRRVDPNYAPAPRLCDFACDAILTIVGIRVSQAYDAAVAIETKNRRPIANYLDGLVRFEQGEDALEFQGSEFWALAAAAENSESRDLVGNTEDSEVVVAGTTVSQPKLVASEELIRVRDRMLSELRPK